MHTIYLITEQGAARTTSEKMAQALEEIACYRRCSQDDYFKKQRQIAALDTAITEGHTTVTGTPGSPSQ